VLSQCRDLPVKMVLDLDRNGSNLGFLISPRLSYRRLPLEMPCRAYIRDSETRSGRIDVNGNEIDSVFSFSDGLSFAYLFP
jgi:hypothetical protein